MRKKCAECGHSTQFERISLEFERKGLTAVVHGIPAAVCPMCGRQYLPGLSSGELTDAVREAMDLLLPIFEKRQEVPSPDGDGATEVPLLEGLVVYGKRQERK